MNYDAADDDDKEHLYNYSRRTAGVFSRICR